MLFNDIDQPDLAVQCCRRGLQQDAKSGALFANLATAMQNLGRPDEAIEYARKSVELQPDAVGAHTNLLYKLNFHPDYDAAAIFQEHLEWARRHAEPLTARAAGHANDRIAGSSAANWLRLSLFPRPCGQFFQRADDRGPRPSRFRDLLL